MTTTPTHSQVGMPCWVSHRGRGLAADQRFYTSIFGWRYDDRVVPGGSSFVVASADGLHAASLARRDAPSTWVTAILVDDADETLARAQAAGGRSAGRTVDLPDRGRSHTVIDPAGAELLLMQLREPTETAAFADAPGTWWTSALCVSDPAVVGEFYRTLFGWTVVAGVDGPAFRDVASPGASPGLHDVLDAPRIWPLAPGQRPEWVPVFRVDDVEPTMEAVIRHGGHVLIDHSEGATPYDAVVCADPGGASFAVIDH